MNLQMDGTNNETRFKVHTYTHKHTHMYLDMYTDTGSAHVSADTFFLFGSGLVQTIQNDWMECKHRFGTVLLFCSCSIQIFKTLSISFGVCVNFLSHSLIVLQRNEKKKKKTFKGTKQTTAYNAYHIQTHTHTGISFGWLLEQDKLHVLFITSCFAGTFIYSRTRDLFSSINTDPLFMYNCHRTVPHQYTHTHTM